MNQEEYFFKKIEQDAQKFWEQNETFNANLKSKNHKRYYVLGMFPYPSGTLHAGHLRNYIITDIVARFKRAQKFDVLHPIGWDAFGLPAENAAIQNKISPDQWTIENISNMRNELFKLGISYNWNNEISTCEPDYYKHEQKFFLALIEKGIAYKKKGFVNWDPVDQTVLANEQIIDGKGWRSGAPVVKKEMTQWYLKTTNYSERLLDGLKDLTDWPENIIKMQEQWIGKQSGLSIEMQSDKDKSKFYVFTYTPEIIYSATFCAISPEHSISLELIKNNPELGIILNNRDEKEELGMYTQINLFHPITNKVLPLYIANFATSECHSAIIMCHPAHNLTHYNFAKKYNIDILPVIETEQNQDTRFSYSQNDILINSQSANGLTISAAKTKIQNMLSKCSQNATHYRLRDWCVSRQRYWGCPIPIINCKKCGIIPNKDIPVSFPKNLDYSQKNKKPIEGWMKTKCPNCGSDASRETDTLDTFFESSWYFLSFTNKKHTMFAKESNNHWMPVDLYVGGIEHAVLHLLYARLFALILKDIGFLNNPHPFKRLVTQGMVCHKTYQDLNNNYITPEEALNMKDVVIGKSIKMSKSKKNTISLKSVTETYGADASRMFIVSDSPPEKNFEWSLDGIKGCERFMKKLWQYAQGVLNAQINADAKDSDELSIATNELIKDVSEMIESMKLNTAIARIRECFNLICSLDPQKTRNLKKYFLIFLQILEPFVPHIAHAIITKIYGPAIISNLNWPKYNPLIKKATRETVVVISINGKKKSMIKIDESCDEKDIIEKSKKEIAQKLENKKIYNTIYIKNRMINFVIKDESKQ